MQRRLPIYCKLGHQALETRGIIVCSICGEGLLQLTQRSNHERSNKRRYFGARRRKRKITR